jgi:hypothetical protein
MDFVRVIQEHVRDGWLIDFDDNESVPNGTMGYYTCRMRKGEKLAALLRATPDIPEHEVKQQPVEVPFVPSVVMQVEHPIVETKGRVGRTKSNAI